MSENAYTSNMLDAYLPLKRTVIYPYGTVQYSTVPVIFALRGSLDAYFCIHYTVPVPYEP